MRRLVDPASGISAVAQSPAGGRFLDGLAQIQRADRQIERAWHEELRRRGVTLAHPDDGWVDRERHTVLFAYPSLRAAPPLEGALVALGTPEKWRLVRLTARRASLFGPEHDRWVFESVAS